MGKDNPMFEDDIDPEFDRPGDGLHLWRNARPCHPGSAGCGLHGASGQLQYACILVGR
jgi:hypothetical protein